RNPGWGALKQAYEAIGREIESSGAELLLIYSTQWFSVIGHLFQVAEKPKWVLVDQNWYELGEIPYEFRMDPAFGKLYAETAKQHGLQASTVDYPGFPIDTGTVVALKLLNPNNAIPASVVSCNIYAEREETRTLGRAGRAAIDAYGKRTTVVCVTNLSNRYEVAEIDPAHDKISSQKDDEGNRKIVEMLGGGRSAAGAGVAGARRRENRCDREVRSRAEAGRAVPARAARWRLPLPLRHRPAASADRRDSAGHRIADARLHREHPRDPRRHR